MGFYAVLPDCVGFTLHNSGIDGFLIMFASQCTRWAPHDVELSGNCQPISVLILDRSLHYPMARCTWTSTLQISRAMSNRHNVNLTAPLQYLIYVDS